MVKISMRNTWLVSLASSTDVQATIHESIKKREIILPEEHAGQHGFDYAWKSLMQRSRTAGMSQPCVD